MQQARVFVSSTCFDLASVREAIADALRVMGHVPVLSEHPSFGVEPTIDAIANCRANVRTNADVFVLVIGGRRGSVDPATGKSIVNLEYDEAKSAGLPTVVLVQKALLDLLPVWERNPKMEVAPHADSPQVLEFVKRIRDDKAWTFNFGSNSEIVSVLRVQLSAMLRRSLDYRRRLMTSPLRAFEIESDEARDLAVGRPSNWKNLLLRELLKHQIPAGAEAIRSMRAGTEFLPLRSMDIREYFVWMQARPRAILQVNPMIHNGIIPKWKAVMESPSAVPSDILNCARILRSMCEGLVTWERDQRSVLPPDEFAEVHECTLEWGGNAVLDLERFYHDLCEVLEKPDLSGLHEITIVMKSPPRVDEFMQAMSQLEQNPAILAAIRGP